jgi:hypothetical protein
MDDQMRELCLYPQDATKPYVPSTFGPNNRFVRGTGTSEAAALTSGAAALMLSANPSLKADQVKNILKTTTSPISGTAAAVGAGEINLTKALPSTLKPAAFTQTASVSKGGQIDDARGGASNSKYTFHQFVHGYYEDTPGACTDLWDNQTEWGLYTGDPARRQAISDAYLAGCHLEALRDRPMDPSATGGEIAENDYTTGKWTGPSKDIFGNTMDMAKLQTAEATGTAWQKPFAGAAYEVWSADPALTLGAGWGPTDAVLGKVWAAGPAWPGNWQRAVQRKAFVTDNPSTLTWSSTTKSWTRFSFRSQEWARFSFTGCDWSRFSFRDNSWS